MNYFELEKELDGRVNVMTRETERKQLVVIYDDHRWLLNVLFAVNKLTERPDLIFFDAHDDAAQCEKKSELLAKIGIDNLMNASAKQFSAFVDYNQREDDGGWLTTAMELNLIGDVVNIGNRYNDSIRSMNGSYESEDGIKHGVWELSYDLKHELGNRGKLGDSCKENENRTLRNFFGIEHSYSDLNSVTMTKPYILDFDLDFFTISCTDDSSHGWTERILNRHFPTYSKQDDFLRMLIHNAMVITICREPDCCGSIGDSNRILSLLDRYYFKGTLGTNVTL